MLIEWSESNSVSRLRKTSLDQPGGIRCRAPADPNTHDTLTCLFPLSAEPVHLSANVEHRFIYFFVLPAWTSTGEIYTDVNKFLDNKQLLILTSLKDKFTQKWECRHYLLTLVLVESQKTDIIYMLLLRTHVHANAFSSAATVKICALNRV